MGLITDEQSAMAHVLKTAGKARTWVAPGSAEKNMGLKSHPARSFCPDRHEKRENPPVWRPPGCFYPGGIRRGVEGLFPWETVARAPGGTDDSWPLRRRYSRGYRGTLTLPRGPGPWPTPPAGPANAAPTPAHTATRAPRASWPAPSTPTSVAVGRDFLQDQGHFHRDQDPLPAMHTVNSACSGSQVLALRGVTIMRKMAACWTCGRTFWVWRLRERNFCSGKCRVRHHRSRGYRNPNLSKVSNN